MAGGGHIYVQVASYRDPELLPTLADCLARAADPARLRFGLCWQHDETETLGDYGRDARFRVIDVDYRRSRGVCWARHRIQQLYDGEAYTLHLDSHHRFVDGWDDLLVAMLEDLRRGGSAKPILTSYAPVYHPERDPEGRERTPYRTRFRRFSREGVAEALPETIDDFAARSAPIPARFFSAHFAFSLGELCREVPHDPKLYFFGEEPTLAVRAFTHGYDLYCPHRLVLWHHYGREKTPKHWSDHGPWAFHDQRSLQRVRQLLRIGGTPCDTDFGPYGLGSARSLRDFEVYAGIHYGLLGVSDHALANRDPPEPNARADDPDWAARFARPQTFRVELRPEEIPLEPRDFDFWYVGAHAANDLEVYRHDVSGAELASLLEPPHALELSFHTTQFPESWTVWPHSTSRGWLTKITRRISS